MLTLPLAALFLNQQRPPYKVSILKTASGYQLMRGTQKYFIKGAGGDSRLKELRECGGNSVRIWGADQAPKVLDDARRKGVSVMFGHWLGHKEYFDYKDPKQVAEQYAIVKRDIFRYKNHPAVLMWAMGNEMEIGNDIPETWMAIEELAKMAKRIDPLHPVITVVAEVSPQKIANIKKYCPSIDALGINSYGGLPTLPKRLKEAGWTKPYIITEFGPLGPWEMPKTPWGAACEPTSTEKAKKYASDYQKSISSQAGWCLGSYAFLWGDKQEETPTWFGMYLPTGERTEAVDVMIRAWSGHLPHNCCPEIVSYSLDIRGKEVEPGSMMRAKVVYRDPDSKDLKVRWEVRDETPERKHDGEGEKTGRIVPGAWQIVEGGAIEVRVPDAPGRYRLYVYITDGKGSAAVGNHPFRVK